jgi:hypothetical protein
MADMLQGTVMTAKKGKKSDSDSEEEILQAEKALTAGERERLLIK